MPIKSFLDYYGTDADAFISYIKDMHLTFNLPIRVTEWACQVTERDVLEHNNTADEGEFLRILSVGPNVLPQRYPSFFPRHKDLWIERHGLMDMPGLVLWRT